MASSTKQQVARIDLDQPVTKEQYRTALQALWEAGRQVARSHDWCTAWISIFHDKINSDFPYERDRYGELRGDVDVAEPQHDSDFDYGTELKNTRGRILWYVREGSVYLDEANRALQSAGIDGYAVTEKVFNVTVPRFTVAAGSETAATIQDRLNEAIRELNVEGVTVHAPQRDVEVRQAVGPEAVPASETVEPMPRG